MALLDRFRPLQALEQVIEREHAALLSADFEALEGLEITKIKLFDLVVKAGAPHSKMRSLSDKIERNNHLLRAAAHGIKTAQIGLSKMRQTSTTFNTYGPEGAATQIGHKSLTIKRKL